MAKLARERAVKERRERKKEKKDEKKLAAANDAQVESTVEADGAGAEDTAQ